MLQTDNMATGRACLRGAVRGSPRLAPVVSRSLLRGVAVSAAVCPWTACGRPRPNLRSDRSTPPLRPLHHLHARGTHTLRTACLNCAPARSGWLCRSLRSRMLVGCSLALWVLVGSLGCSLALCAHYVRECASGLVCYGSRCPTLSQWQLLTCAGYGYGAQS